MKMLGKTILCILALAVLASAATTGTNYTVKAGGGGNYTTIQSCVTAMAAGDTCTVYAGTYNETVSVTAGSAGAYKTVTVNGTDVVTVRGFSINPYVKIIGNCPKSAALGTCGFTIQNVSSPGSACVSVSANTHDTYFVGNVMQSCGGFSYGNNNANQSHNFIQRNTLSYTGGTPSSPNGGRAGTINGDYNLFEDNDISHVSDGMYVFGKHNVVRNNVFHDVVPGDCIVSGSQNCHIDFIQADAVTPAGQPAQYLLIEGNTVKNLTYSASTHAVGILQAESCGGQCFNAIIRFQLSAHIGGGGIVDDNSFSTSTPGWYNVKSYNNTWVDVGNQNTGNGNGINGFTHGSPGGAVINDLYYFPFSLNDWNPYFTDSGSLPFTSRNNLAYCTSSTCGLHSHLYGVGTWTDDPGNILANPMFANYAGDDFSLLPGSPAFAAGSYLTTIASSDSGSGTSLVVSDAGYFQDGSGISGVNSDCISIGIVTNHVCIISVNYQTNTLTLSSSITRSPGAPVWLYSDSTGRTVLTGTAPNMGAIFDSSQVVSPPTGLAALVN